MSREADRRVDLQIDLSTQLNKQIVKPGNNELQPQYITTEDKSVSQREPIEFVCFRRT